MLLVDESERWTVVRLPHPSTLLGLFQKKTPTILQYEAGERNVVDLVYGYFNEFQKKR